MVMVFFSGPAESRGGGEKEDGEKGKSQEGKKVGLSSLLSLLLKNKKSSKSHSHCDFHLKKESILMIVIMLIMMTMILGALAAK